MTAFLILSCVSLLLPLAFAVWIARRRHLSLSMTWALLGMGAAGWIIAKIPKGVVILAMFKAKGLPLQMDEATLERALARDVVLLLVAAVTAGIFEEAGKPILLYFTPKIRQASAPAVLGALIGIGAGVLEALNFETGALVRVLMYATPIATQTYVPVERVLATIFHATLTAMLVHMSMNGRAAAGLVLAALLHSVADFLIPWLQVNGRATMWQAEGVFLVVVVLALITATLVVRFSPARSLASVGDDGTT